MRVSTQQFYYQSTQQMTNTQSEVNRQSNYLSSGKRVMSAKDDAISFSTLSGYKNELTKLDQYQRNMTSAKNRNSLTETSLSLTESTLQRVKQLFLQANNGSLSNSDRSSIADNVQQHFNQILDIANTKDETGGYIFSGFQVDQAAFTVQPDNTVSYHGDTGVKKLAIANNVDIALNQTGDQVFNKVPNAVGDFSPTYLVNNGNISVTSASIVNRGVYDKTSFPPDYTLNFTDTNSDGVLEVSVVDSASNNVVTINPYTPGNPIQFNGVEVKVDGQPSVGDKVSLKPAQNVSVFDTLKAAISWLKTGSTPATDGQHTVDYNHILKQLDSAQSYISSQQAQAGINLNLIDRQTSNQADTRLYMEKGKSSIEDLDFASAVSQFEQSKVALQAAQKTYTQVQKLSLFNYI